MGTTALVLTPFSLPQAHSAGVTSPAMASQQQFRSGLCSSVLSLLRPRALHGRTHLACSRLLFLIWSIVFLRMKLSFSYK
ncbi:hypothetical protein ACP4OV_001602 [Aristida adscensionis]